MSQALAMTVNGRAVSVTVDDPEMPLLYALRNDLGLTGPHYGCGLGQCGACTVLVDGAPVRSCSYPVKDLAAMRVTTVEGMRGPNGELHPLQKALLAEQAGQCGYCLPGMVMTAASLLSETRNPAEGDIRSALDGNLCRCGSHNRIVRAVQRAAAEMAR
jgi:nicotinate dehydrogenase subunit A